MKRKSDQSSVNNHRLITHVSQMMTLTCGIGVVQAVASSYDDVTITHLCYILQFAHVASWYSALMLKVSVKDHDASVVTAAPELLVDDAHGITWMRRNHDTRNVLHTTRSSAGLRQKIVSQKLAVTIHILFILCFECVLHEAGKLCDNVKFQTFFAAFRSGASFPSTATVAVPWGTRGATCRVSFLFAVTGKGGRFPPTAAVDAPSGARGEACAARGEACAARGEACAARGEARADRTVKCILLSTSYL